MMMFELTVLNISSLCKASLTDAIMPCGYNAAMAEIADAVFIVISATLY